MELSIRFYKSTWNSNFKTTENFFRFSKAFSSQNALEYLLFAFQKKIGKNLKRKEGRTYWRQNGKRMVI